MNYCVDHSENRAGVEDTEVHWVVWSQRASQWQASLQGWDPSQGQSVVFPRESCWFRVRHMTQFSRNQIKGKAARLVVEVYRWELFPWAGNKEACSSGFRGQHPRGRRDGAAGRSQRWGWKATQAPTQREPGSFLIFLSQWINQPWGLAFLFLLWASLSWVFCYF